MSDNQSGKALTQHGRPDRMQFLTELPRAGAEAAAFALAWPLLSRLKAGDGHAVMVLPGFTQDDTSTAPLRRLLVELGYEAHGWELGRNLGRAEGQRDAMMERLTTLQERSGRKVSLVGHSLGGIFARELARARPTQVRQVISLGSPFAGEGPGMSNLAPLVQQLTGRAPTEISPAVRRRMSAPLQVPTTAIYTKGDGVVHWRSCVQWEKNHISENIEVRGSHSGLVMNPAVMLAVADRLTQGEMNWQRFHRRGVRSVLFPRPAA